MKLVAIIDWSFSDRLEDYGIGVKGYTFCPKVTGPKGGKLPMVDIFYYDGTLPPNYQVPAIPYVADICTDAPTLIAVYESLTGSLVACWGIASSFRNEWAYYRNYYCM